MAPSGTRDSSALCSKHSNPPHSRFSISNYVPFKLDRVLLAEKSATIASFLEKNSSDDLSVFFKDVPLEAEALELIARFCHGLDVKMTSDNIVSLICLSYYLKMTDTHSPKNLFNKALLFLRQEILPSWDQTIRSLLKLSRPIFQQAMDIGLLDIYVDAITTHAKSNPNFLGLPIMAEYNDSNRNRLANNSNGTRRKLLSGVDRSNTSSDSDTSFEDLTLLPVKLYESIIKGMLLGKVPQEYITGSIYRYFKRHGDDRESIEAIERLLPAISNYPLYPYTILFELYDRAISLGASLECMTSLENQIGKELACAKADDLLALDLDVESLRRILKGYYSNFNDGNPSGLVKVSELMEEYLFEVAKAREIDAKTFIVVAEMASTSHVGSYRSSDGIYRAVDTYLDKHKALTEPEKEEICRVLDFQKMSSEACKHAAMNQRLPLRVLVQVLFVSQLELRDNISKAAGEYCRASNAGGPGNEVVKVVQDEWDDDEREEIEGCHGRNCGVKKTKKVSLWKGMKRKLGCMGSSSDYETLYNCNCQVTKKKNKQEHYHPK